MVISIDTLLIKQLRKLLNVILVISPFHLTRRLMELILFWRICHLDIFTDTNLTDITTVLIYQVKENQSNSHLYLNTL